MKPFKKMMLCMTASVFVSNAVLAQETDTVDVLVSIEDPRGAITLNMGDINFGTIERSATGSTCYVRVGRDGLAIVSNSPSFETAPFGLECEPRESSLSTFNFSCPGDFEIDVTVTVTETSLDPNAPSLYLYSGNAFDGSTPRTISWRQLCSEFSTSQSIGRGLPILAIPPTGGDFSGVVGTLTLRVDYT